MKARLIRAGLFGLAALFGVPLLVRVMSLWVALVFDLPSPAVSPELALVSFILLIFAVPCAAILGWEVRP